MIKKIGLYTFLVITGAFTMLPFWWMLMAAFMPDGQASVYPPRLFPEVWTFAQFERLINRLNVIRYFLNSSFLAILVTAISLFFNSMAGYAFAKYRFAGRDKLFSLLLSSMIIPAQVTMLPLFLMLKSMGLINTYAAVLVPGLANIFGIFLIRQFALGIPDSLIEAARIDGASDFQIYFRIILPLMTPILITLGLFTFLGSWNDFMWPLIVLTDNDLFTLPIALNNLMGEHTKDPELMMAGALMTILPVVFVFLFLQRYYIKGIMLSGLKE